LAIKKEITAVNKTLLRFTHSQGNKNDGTNPADDPRNAMLIKIMMGVFTGYIMLYIISLLLPNSSNPEVNLFTIILNFCTKNCIKFVLKI